MSPKNYFDIFTRLTGSKRIEAVTMLIQNINGLEEIDVVLNLFDLHLKNTTYDSFADNDGFHNNLMEEKVKNVKDSYEFINLKKTMSPSSINSTASKWKSLKDTVKTEQLRSSENKLDKGRYFIDKKPYIKHEAEFHQDRKKMNSKQICNICGASIVGYKMSRHMKSLHTHGDETKCSCQLCGKRFNLKEGLTYHEKRHNNIFKYSCGTCEYKTNKKAHFDRHVNTRINIRPFSCPICKVKMGRKDKLKNHIEGMHGGIYYSCSHCDYKTTWKEYLKRHAIKQHGEASYAPDADEFGVAVGIQKIPVDV